MPAPPVYNVLYLSAEIVPYARTGGLAQVAASLPRALRQLGDDVRIILPRYGLIDPQAQGFRQILSDFPVPFQDDVEMAGLWQAPETDIPLYFIEHERFFGSRQGIYSYPDDAERFIFYSRASLEAMRHLQWQPHIIHCNEWQTAIIANWLRSIYADDPFYRQTAVLYTIHNLSYQGIFGHRILEVAGLARQGFIAHPEASASLNDVVSLMGRGIIFADIITTVSPTYAREILTPALGEGLDPILRDREHRLFGILNGIDTAVYNPQTDTSLPATYDLNHLDGRRQCKAVLQQEMELEIKADIPVISLSSRLHEQKGYDILIAVLDPLLQQIDAQWIIMGVGDQHYHDSLSHLQQRYPQRLALRLTYSEALRRHIFAGSDIFLMPSRHEPCGLDQLIAMRYGAVPVVHATGGLADTVIDHQPPIVGTGITFGNYDSMALFAAIVRAVELYKHATIWAAMQRQAMQQDVSWAQPARAYHDLYRRAYALKNTGRPA